MPTTEAENKEIARKYPEEVISKGNLDLIDEIIAEDYVEHNSARPEPLQRGHRDGARTWL